MRIQSPCLCESTNFSVKEIFHYAIFTMLFCIFACSCGGEKIETQKNVGMNPNGKDYSFYLDHIVGTLYYDVEPNNVYYGYFVFVNKSNHVLELPIHFSKSEGGMLGSKPSFEVSPSGKDNWKQLLVGYDFVPQTTKLYPGQKEKIMINLGRLRSKRSEGGVDTGLLFPQKDYVPYPFHARIQIGEYLSDPFLVK